MGLGRNIEGGLGWDWKVGSVSRVGCLTHINRKGIFADLGAQITMKSFVTHFSAPG